MGWLSSTAGLGIALGMPLVALLDTIIAATTLSRVSTSTPHAICASTDCGETWQGLGVRQSFALPHCRGLALKPDALRGLCVTTGEAAACPGPIRRSRDGVQR